ncbi:MAG TPA: mechanosensitive ion channel domain-containing protein [Acidimicrobiales bacterium]|nr:mechanosensitive ion channel domain-containing protein [Acidimicrobiales bacterium]
MATGVLGAPLLAVTAAVHPVTESQACGSVTNGACVVVFRLTHSQTLARLADLIVTRPLKIVVVIGVALVAHLAARRAINRLVAGMESPELHRLRLRRRRVEGHLPAPRSAQRAATIGSLLRSVASFSIWTIAVATLLGEIGISLGPLLAGAGIAGVAVGFGAQTLVKDFLTGLFMLVEDQYGVGDVIDTGLATGVVEGISLRITRLRDAEGTVWYVPHSSVQRVGRRTAAAPAANGQDRPALS